MTNLFTTKTNFTAGELSQDLLGRADLNAYANGALKLENVFIEPTGGIHRRPGLQYLQTLSGKTRLMSYEQDSEHTYLFLIANEQTKIYQNETLVATLSTPWTTAQLDKLAWCALSDGIIVVHENVQPYRFTLSDSTWSGANFTFLTAESYLHQPYHRFVADNITMASSGCGGTVTLTTSGNVFKASHIGKQFKLADGYVQISAVTNATTATATVLKKLMEGDDIADSTALSATRYWGEPALCSEHGWPATVTTYQSRLVFGGSKELPNTLWFSQTEDISNFEEGTALDSEAITFSLMSDQANKICALFAGRHLQVFTTSAEWMVTGDPLTPTSIQLKRQTQVGSCDSRFIPPVGIDGATIFAAANGKEIREFLFSDLEGIYQATDLSLLAHHLIDTPVDMAYDKYLRQAYVVMQDGTLSVLTSFRAEDMQSWTRQTTTGAFQNVAICGGNAYFIVKNNDTYYLEKFNESIHTDMAFLMSEETPTDTWTGLSVLENKKVQIVADGRVQDTQTVEEGTITLLTSANEVEVGLPFTHIVAPLPPMVGANNGAAPVANARFIRGVFRVVDTQSVEIDTGSGVHQELVPNLANYQMDSTPKKYTLDLVVRGLGWRRNPKSPLWQIEGTLPVDFNLISVTSDIKIGG
ncbi:MAG: hypothetical protein J6T55_01465 [Alphaproteobacteria bacterium]|nr:hypothetical protein [Alphaproteobacteria bacterium]